MLLRWTLVFWGIAYILLTVRSLVIGHPYLLLQAVLRVPMIAVGLGLSWGMWRALEAVEGKSLKTKALTAVAATLVGGFGFGAAAYFFYYLVLPGLWPARLGPAASIFNYMFQFSWIFAAWVLLYFFLRHQARAASAPRYEREFWPSHRGREIRVLADEIAWVESEGDYVRLHTAEREYLMRATMRHMESVLDPANFTRIHRRRIVARRRIAAIVRESDGQLRVELDTGERMPVGRAFLRRIKEPNGSPQQPM